MSGPASHGGLNSRQRTQAWVDLAENCPDHGRRPHCRGARRARRCCRRCSMRAWIFRITATIPSSRSTAVAGCARCESKGCPSFRSRATRRFATEWSCILDDPEVAETRRGVLELLLLNHPLDCPICDKAGECWLQNYRDALRQPLRAHARAAAQARQAPRHRRADAARPGALHPVPALRAFLPRNQQDRRTRGFQYGRPFGARYYDRRLDNDYSMCTADICPVGALETKDFHHKMRVWFLAGNASVCPSLLERLQHHDCECRNAIWRLMPRRNDAVNDTWMCDAGRLNYGFVASPDAVANPMVAHNGTVRTRRLERGAGTGRAGVAWGARNLRRPRR